MPKRSEQRRRRNKETQGIDSLSRAEDFPIPEEDENWESITKFWFNSLKVSAIRQYYDSTDWATALYVAEAMDRNLKSGGKFSGQLFASVMTAMDNLLTTEGARRRARIEIETANDTHEEEDASNVVDLRKRAQGESG
ncbi:phage terminase small subunit [Actinopolyspora erythraea]|uniref:phage terminase small subunit n=1 Tax=Actinopolyspora erythraea TaxID=414996 RepID=UPI003FF10CE7